MHDRRPIEAVRRNGTTFPAEASISQFQVGGEWVMTVRLRDITERKLAEELLKRSEARFRKYRPAFGRRDYRGR